MKQLSVSQEAAKWYMDEMDLEKGDYVQFFVKLYGGIPTVFPSYFLGISEGIEGNIAIQDEVEGITFYFNKEDSWFLDDHDLKVELKGDDPEFIFEERK
ncbi:HesB/YadR/YfhF family protein [Salinibacillus xinjiangensis]|uniref:FeS cluster biogenesis domain-containing protein n=1 Tax=Salinibacillus xinjiangensis TaxID=1229268 RepID=A0A6G1X9W8_9BACI|nr:hypothetical protein [Salinibacillus xinjiangensis]MRG87811.1 hypothetical protein [Salinibacillus xinjiangensis]